MKIIPLKTQVLYLSSVFVMTVSISCAAQQIDVSQQSRELNIMSNIFEAAMEENSLIGRNGAPESVYLHNQGMVFTFSFAGGFGQMFDFRQLISDLDIDLEIRAPQVTIVDVEDHTSELYDELQLNLPDAGAFQLRNGFRTIVRDRNWTDSPAMAALNQGLEEVNARLREKQFELQALQRSLLEGIAVEGEEEGLSNVRENIAALENELTAERAQMREYSQQIQEEVVARQAQQAQELTEGNQVKADSIFTTLCDYGSTLKALDNNENVTLIFENYSSGEDVVHVFSAQDVKSCSSAERLLTDGASYQQ